MNVRELLPATLLAAHHRPANRQRGGWYEIRNTAGEDRARVDLYDAIGWDPTPAEFVRDLRDIDAPIIELHINSPGGFVFDGLTIYNALRDHPARVEAIVDGLAASAASWILQAGDTRTMNRHTQAMIHDALMLTIGNESDHLDSAAILGRTSNEIAAIYAERGVGTVTDWRDAMHAETWYSAQEAVDAGLADTAVAEGDQSDNYSARAPLVAALWRGRHLERTA
ncbi:MAG TPA: head maturation protease, ClpP-related [Actinoplanes sp.]|jgi:ATP-dependent protease ClpP protease subunit|nr:head maturation protease, ClpP-related [Actinoplanes sp.]